MDLMNLMDTSENLHNLAFKENQLLSHRNQSLTCRNCVSKDLKEMGVIIQRNYLFFMVEDSDNVMDYQAEKIPS